MHMHSCQSLEVPKREKQGSRECNPGQVQGKPPFRKLGISGLQRVIFKPFHATFKCNNQGEMLLPTLTLILTLTLMLPLTLTLTLNINLTLTLTPFAGLQVTFTGLQSAFYLRPNQT